MYSFIKGPGTVGIDSNGDLLEVSSTVFEALDYYGIYHMTRPVFVPAPQSPPITSEGDESQPIYSVNNENTRPAANSNNYTNQSNCSEIDVLKGFLVDEDDDLLLTSATALPFQDNASTSNALKGGKKKKESMFSPSKNNNGNEKESSSAKKKRERRTTILRRISSQHPAMMNNKNDNDNLDFSDPPPMESADVINNRRISMGIYGMYSKFM